ncbi:MAG TPA: 2-deoxy-D-gluconate 3-dehydrogenase [Clostridiales bacterium]|nr:2-deoxy-D-gluconate 3-dehydrogenase [Clostridiales bacterium]
MQDLFDIRGRVALITGANRGIGKAIALGFAQAGADIAIVSSKYSPETVAEIEQLGVRCQAWKYDLSDCGGLAGLVGEIAGSMGTIDILVNNAGTQRRYPCVDFPQDEWDTVMNINAKAVFYLCQAAGRLMIARGYGKIINMASMMSFQGGLTIPAYAGSKGAVTQFTKTLANEWAAKGVNVNCIAPGYFLTDMNAALVSDPVRSSQIMARLPAGRWGEPADIVGAALFLASHASDYVHGIVIPVDGGWLAR